MSLKVLYICCENSPKTLSHVHAVVAPGFCIRYLRCAALLRNVMAGDSGLMRARAPGGQMQLHALTGSHQEEAAVNSNSLRMVMELTVFVGRGQGARGKSTGKRRSGGLD